MKIHLRHTECRADKYKSSPHIVAAINTRNWSFCLDIIPDSHITDDPGEITCRRCMAISASYENGSDDELNWPPSVFIDPPPPASPFRVKFPISFGKIKTPEPRFTAEDMALLRQLGAPIPGQANHIDMRFTLVDPPPLPAPPPPPPPAPPTDVSQWWAGVQDDRRQNGQPPISPDFAPQQ